MEEVGIARARRISPVQADNVVVLVFHPNASQKAPVARTLLGCHVEDDAAHIALKLAMHIFEIVVTAVKILAVGKDHPRKAHRLVFELEQFSDAAKHSVLEAGLFREIVAAIDRVRHIHAAEEIMILNRRRSHLVIELQIL